MLSWLVLSSWLEASHFPLSSLSHIPTTCSMGSQIQGRYALTWIVPDNKDPLSGTCRDDVNWAVLTLLPRITCPSPRGHAQHAGPQLLFPFPATHSLLTQETLLFLPRALGITKMGGSFQFLSLDPILASLYFRQDGVVKTQTTCLQPPEDLWDTVWCGGAPRCLTICDPRGLSPARLLCPGDSPGRTLKWVAMSSCRESFQPRNQTHFSCISCIGRQIPYHCATWEALLPAVNPQKFGRNESLIIFDCQVWG